MQQSRAKHICFYSNRCQWSKAFLTELSTTPYKDEFRYVCVDPGPNRPQLPGFLKKVPTIVIQGESEPRTDGDVMNWLSERRLASGGGGAASGGLAGDPTDYYSCEMDSIGQDMYSFIDSDTTANGDGGAMISQTFAFVNDPVVNGSSMQASGKPAAAAAAGQKMTTTNHDPKRSKKEELFDKQIEAYMKNRDAGMPQMKPRI